MPMGSAHRAINTIVSVPLFGWIQVGFHLQTLEVALFAGGYTFATFFMNPDLDLASDGYQSWGLLRFYWLPYQKTMTHRSFWSHFPVVSTLLRVAYLLWLPVVLFFLLGASVQSAIRELAFDWNPVLREISLFTILGMVCSDTLHLFLDLTNTRIKRNKRRRKRARKAKVSQKQHAKNWKVKEFSSPVLINQTFESH